MPESRKEPLSKYTADRNIPGAFEGETVTRRRFMVMTTHTAGGIATAAVLLPVLGFAAGSGIFERAPVIWTPIGKPDDFPDDDYLPRVITTVQGISTVGKTTVYVLSDKEKEEWRKALVPVHKEMENRIGKDLIAAVYKEANSDRQK